jgi:hypothetical protein
MSLKTPLAALAVVLGLQVPSLAQDPMAPPSRETTREAPREEVPDIAQPPAAKPKADEPPPEVKGNRFSITLRTGGKVEGILPQGVRWEKRDQYGEFVEAAETEKGAGLRLNYVLNMEGDIFVQKKDIAEVKDLGALTDEQKLAIKDKVLANRKKALEEREKIFREEMARQGAAAKEAAKEAEKEGKGKSEEKGAEKKEGEGKGEKKAAISEADMQKGDALLEKFPPSDWGPKRLKDILRREVVNGIFRSDEEAEFIVNFDLWKDAFERKAKEEDEKEAETKEAGAAEAGK